MIASESLLAAWDAVLSVFTRLSKTELLINLGLTAVVVLLAWAIGAGLKRMLRAAIERIPGEPTEEKTLRAARASRVAHLVIGLSVAGVALVVVGGLWGLDVLRFLTVGPGAQGAGVVFHLALILVAAVVAMEAAAFLIGHALARLETDDVEPRRRAQLRTLGPLLAGLAQSAVVIIAILMALGEIGVQVGPLLAGAGVVGIALGFGAQTVVKDLLTGVFLVVEDIVSVGDIVRIGDHAGLVEKMTLRTICLRDLDGALHVFPYGEAQIVHNLTKTFAYYVFNLQISYSSDIDRAFDLMRCVGAEMQIDPDYGEKILEPLEVMGVDSLADSGVVLKARIKTKPIEQWAVGREYNRRIKLLFDREGIEIPFPHMKVVLPAQQLDELVRH